MAAVSMQPAALANGKMTFAMSDIAGDAPGLHFPFIQQLVERISELERQTQGLLQQGPALKYQGQTQLLPASSSHLESCEVTEQVSTQEEPTVVTAREAVTPSSTASKGEATSSSSGVPQIPTPNGVQPQKTRTTPLALEDQILNIVENYGYSDKSTPDGSWLGKATFKPIVEEHIKAGTAVRMVLPAFPFKSPNRKDKVLGSLPDLGEEVALAHLNGLCERIGEIYEHGAEVYIASDGLIYNDLLGVSDEDVWVYGETLRELAAAKEFHHVKFVRLWDLLLHHNQPSDNLKDYYLLHASCLRREIVARYEDPDFDARTYLRNDVDACKTYRGYIKFLTMDLWHSEHNRDKSGNQGKGGKIYKQALEQVARSMISRGKVFSAAIKAKFGDCVRLSIHPSVGEKKLPLSLIPQKTGSFGLTPWHSCIAVGTDGSFNTVHATDVRGTHDLIYQDGRPYYFREKSDLYDWGEIQVEFEHLYPCGLIVRPRAGAGIVPSLRDVDGKKLRGLAQLQSPVVCRGFADTTTEEVFQSKAYELGSVLPWTYGIMQKVKDAGRTDKLANNVTSSEAMPMHYDGMFKFVTETDENGNEIKKQAPPGFQYFTSIATAPKGSGYTLFASSRLFFQYLPRPYTATQLEKVTWRMDNNGFWDAKLDGLPLVVKHPIHKTPCLRWHQPWDSTKTRFSTCEVTIENDSQAIVDLVDTMLYDRRVCLYFTWEKGDILVSDNTAMLHTRTGYTATGCDRELWRIHFD